ncbi:MAG: hypothetical protein ILP09_05825 [Oscillospiraceae bacterium]|nr:hypothetical protein [Oscillospiraceae bacterium]
MIKRMLALLLVTAALLTAAGCAARGGGTDGGAVEKPDLPTRASLPGSMSADDILALISFLVGYDESGEKIFELKKTDADSFEVPGISGNKERLYLFQIEDLEIAVFADLADDGVTSLYVRRMYDDDLVEAYMASFAGAFLSLLEPEKYESMLAEVLPNAADGEVSSLETKTASGDHWRIEYSKDIAKIMPAA